MSEGEGQQLTCVIVNSCKSHLDASSEHLDMPIVTDNVKTAENMPESLRTRQTRLYTKLT